MAERYVAFDFFQGHALSQKRKCQIGLHQNFLAFDDDFTKDETRQRREDGESLSKRRKHW